MSKIERTTLLTSCDPYIQKFLCTEKISEARKWTIFCEKVGFRLCVENRGRVEDEVGVGVYDQRTVQEKVLNKHARIRSECNQKNERRNM